MADIEKARKRFAEIHECAERMMSGKTSCLQHIRKLAEMGGDALDGDGAEEWTVERWGADKWLVKGRDQHSATLGLCTLAQCATEATARRIARLPVLERAAQPFSDMAGELFARNWNASRLVTALDNPSDPHRVTAGDYFQLRAALKQEGQP